MRQLINFVSLLADGGGGERAIQTHGIPIQARGTHAFGPTKGRTSPDRARTHNGVKARTHPNGTRGTHASGPTLEGEPWQIFGRNPSSTRIQPWAKFGKAHPFIDSVHCRSEADRGLDVIAFYLLAGKGLHGDAHCHAFFRGGLDLVPHGSQGCGNLLRDQESVVPTPGAGQSLPRRRSSARPWPP